ncbi:MAG: recombination mediator RecR [Bacteroidota bacterium]
MHYSSKLLEDAINEFAKLPGVGKKTAMRYVLYLLSQNNGEVNALTNSLIKLKNELRYCSKCHNISDKDICDICSSPYRDNQIVCVVEDIRDVMAIENTQQYKGVYHILGGVISPLDGIGPNDLNIGSLLKKIASDKIKEVIMALRTTMEGDTTNFYIYKRIRNFNLIISTVARGIAIGNELEYTDEVTLARSIINRIPYENILLVK